MTLENTPTAVNTPSLGQGANQAVMMDQHFITLVKMIETILTLSKQDTAT